MFFNFFAFFYLVSVDILYWIKICDSKFVKINVEILLL